MSSSSLTPCPSLSPPSAYSPLTPCPSLSHTPAPSPPTSCPSPSPPLPTPPCPLTPPLMQAELDRHVELQEGMRKAAESLWQMRHGKVLVKVGGWVGVQWLMRHGKGLVKVGGWVGVHGVMRHGVCLVKVGGWVDLPLGTRTGKDKGTHTHIKPASWAPPPPLFILPITSAPPPTLTHSRTHMHQVPPPALSRAPRASEENVHVGHPPVPKPQVKAASPQNP